MSGNGRGSVSAKLDTFRSAGKHEAIALQVLANVAEGLAAEFGCHVNRSASIAEDRQGMTEGSQGRLCGAQ